MKNLNAEIIEVIRNLYPSQEFIPLHEPRFDSTEKEILSKCIDSTFVSSVGMYVDEFEARMAKFTGAKYAIATTNGTSALHVSLLLAGVKPGDEILTQALTFIATANAISYCSAKAVFVDSDKKTLGLCPEKLEQFLAKNTEKRSDGFVYNKKTGARIKACVPMHVFGHPCEIKKIADVCKRYNLILIEDAAEALGSYVDGQHVGNIGQTAILSFNGNKIITCGGGGMIITNDEVLAKKAKHLTTTAKVPHRWEFMHDELGYNYRLPNLNAALACAQMEKLPSFIQNKRKTAEAYKKSFENLGVQFLSEPSGTTSNYWLNAILFPNKEMKESFLEFSNSQKVMTRPLWKLMNEIPMYKNYETTGLEVAQDFYDRLVNIPSSVRLT